MEAASTRHQSPLLSCLVFVLLATRRSGCRKRIEFRPCGCPEIEQPKPQVGYRCVRLFTLVGDAPRQTGHALAWGTAARFAVDPD